MNETKQGLLHDRAFLLSGARLVAALILGISLLTAIVPMAPLMPDIGLDPSWMHGLNEASSQHMAFGSGIMATFGPYASFFTEVYHPSTDGLTFVLSMALAAAYLLITAILFHGRTGGGYLLAAMFFALATLDRNIIFFSLPTLLALAIHRLTSGEASSLPSPKSLRLLSTVAAAGGMASGLLCLSKGSMIPYSWVMLVLCAGWLAYRRHLFTAFLLLMAYITAVLLFWLIAGQSLTDLPGYFTSTLEVISGYTDAMSFPGALWQWIAYLLIAAVTLLLIGVENSKTPTNAIFLGLVAAACYFFCFKAAFTRHDGLVFKQTDLILSTGHAGTATLALLLVALCSQVFFASQPRRWVAASLGVLGFTLIIGSYGPANIPAGTRYLLAAHAAARHVFTTQVDALDGIRSRMGITPTPAARYEHRLALIREQLDLPALKGSWDMYSYDQSLLLVHEVQWKPRPAFQSYFAYTPSLLQANAHHLQGSDAPDNILFKVQPIDYRYPAQDDSLSWPYLMGLYVPTKRLSHDFLLLERRPVNDPQRQVLVPTYQPATTIRLGERVQLPEGSGLRYVRLQLRKTLIGKAMSLAYKTPFLVLQVELKNGRKDSYRLIPGIAEAGFLMSPAIDSSDMFAFAATGQLEVLEPYQVMAFTVSCSAVDSLAWRDEVSFSLSAPR